MQSAMRRSVTALRCAATAALLLCAPPAIGQTAPAGQADAGFWERPNLLGDIGGLRPAFDDRGITLGLSETSEIFGNLGGGIRRGFEYSGLTTLSLKLDTDKALHWRGGTFYASALQIHGRDFSTDHVASLQTITNIDAERSTRLWELWFQQPSPDGKSDLKIGQQAVDQEFLVNDDGSVFLNAMMGWPALPSTDMYAGAPVYPLSALGLRLRAKPADGLTLLAGVFDDNPPGGPFADDAQVRDGEASGTRFNLSTGALFIAELQYAVPRPPFAAEGADLPGTYKFGAWFDTGRFPDQRFDQAGLSLADPASSGVARLHKDNFSFYGVLDQTVWRATGGHSSLALFGRVMGASSDRNLVDWSLNAGLNLKAPLPGRDNDTLGVGYGWAHVSGRASDLDRDAAIFAASALPVRSAESVIEITYQYQVAPWWLVQPDLQYVINPGGGAASPLDPTRRLGDALVVGLRTNVTF